MQLLAGEEFGTAASVEEVVGCFVPPSTYESDVPVPRVGGLKTPRGPSN